MHRILCRQLELLSVSNFCPVSSKDWQLDSWTLQADLFWAMWDVSGREWNSLEKPQEQPQGTYARSDYCCENKDVLQLTMFDMLCCKWSAQAATKMLYCKCSAQKCKVELFADWFEFDLNICWHGLDKANFWVGWLASAAQVASNLLSETNWRLVAKLLAQPTCLTLSTRLFVPRGVGRDWS